MCLKVLASANALGSAQGRLVIAVLLFQDVAAVAFLLLHDSMSGAAEEYGVITVVASATALVAALFIARGPLQLLDTSEGVIGVWDAAGGYTRYDEFPSGGIGPHDLRLMPDAETLIVANGGIATDPTDRRKLNVPTMRPNLTYLSLSGSTREQVELEEDLRQNSIRHLAVRHDGLVGFAMQWEGEPGSATPLLGLHRMGNAPLLAEAPLADELAMQGYAGSVAFSGDGSEIAITSPRGGRVHRFSDDGVFLAALSRADVCGIAPMDRGYLASDGQGGLISISTTVPTPLARADCAWDNHIVAL